MTEIEIQRNMLNQVIKKIIARITEYQKQLEVEKKDRSELGMFEDCGQYYQDQVKKTEAIIEELISQKIYLEKWRKKLSYEKI
jgi:predicted DNA-binding protein YlxM (UPF0122 family)